MSESGIREKTSDRVIDYFDLKDYFSGERQIDHDLYHSRPLLW